MLDYGLDETSAKEMKARVLKHMIETVLPILLEPDTSNSKSQEVRKEGNIFNCFAVALLKGCENLDKNEVWLHTYVNYCIIKARYL